MTFQLVHGMIRWDRGRLYDDPGMRIIKSMESGTIACSRSFI